MSSSETSKNLTYELKKEDKIGQGAYSIAYAARLKFKNLKINTENTEVPVVVKRNFTDDGVIKFTVCIREMDMLIRLKHLHQHPSMISFIDCIFSDEPFEVKSPTFYDQIHRNDTVHFIFERADCPLIQVIRNPRLIPDKASIFLWLQQIIEGIAFLHHWGILHRDIKPDNILLKQGNGTVCAKICDFGLSKVTYPTEPMTPRVCTPWYRAPEITLSEKLTYDNKVDWWSFGCLLYELITGHAYFQCDDRKPTQYKNKVIQELLGRGHKKPRHQMLPDLLAPNPAKTFIIGCKELGHQAQIFVTEPEWKEILVMLEGLLNPNPAERWNQEPITKLKIFSGVSWNFTGTVEKSNLENLIYPTDWIWVDCPERNQVLEWLCIFLPHAIDNLVNYPRIILMTLRLMERYISHVNRSKYDIDGALTSVKSDAKFKGSFWDFEATLIRFLACWYISIKFYTHELRDKFSWEKSVPSQYHRQGIMVWVKNFEKNFFNKSLNGLIFIESIVEYRYRVKQKEWTPAELHALLQFCVGYSRIGRVIVSEFYERFEKFYDDYSSVILLIKSIATREQEMRHIYQYALEKPRPENMSLTDYYNNYVAMRTKV